MAFVTKSTSYLRFNNTSYKDYLAINGSSQSNTTSFTGTEPTSGTTPDLYNGNIRQMVTSYLDAAAPNKTYGLKSLLRNYTYDQLNRITSANSNDNLNTTTNTWGSPSITGLYAETFTYDQNGNILTLNRKGNLSGTQQHMDDLQYHYIANTNKLDYVTDLVTANNYSDDIKNGQTSGNYQYDAIGNLTKDEQEHISDIKWTVYGKIKKITKSSGPISEINFDYDASGNRISKNVVYGNGNSNTIYYIRDAQGNTMATYENNIMPSTSNTYSLTEQHIYGSFRLGMNTNKIDPSVVLSNGNYFTRNVDQISYELSNHLGNVVATVNAKKIAVENTNDNVVDYFSGEILSGTDYYSFGAPMPGRNYQGSSSYRYGFNGKESDDELKGDGNSYDFGARIYDPRIGRWLARDPQSAKYPSQSPYHFGYNNPIITIDPNGEENIVVVGIDVAGKDRYKFINSGLKKAEEFSSNQSDEQTTIVLVTAGMTSKEIADTYVQALSIDKNVNIIQVKTTDQLNNYLNSKSISDSKLSPERTADKITDFVVYDHGYAGDASVPGDQSSVEFGHGMANSGTEAHDKLTYDVNDIKALNPEAFDNVNAEFESCNGATENKDGNSLVKTFSEQTKGKATGWKGKSDYSGIYGAFKSLFGKQIESSSNYPSAGKTNDRKEKSTKVTYDKGKKQTP